MHEKLVGFMQDKNNRFFANLIPLSQWPWRRLTYNTSCGKLINKQIFNSIKRGIFCSICEQILDSMFLFLPSKTKQLLLFNFFAHSRSYETLQHFHTTINARSRYKFISLGVYFITRLVKAPGIAWVLIFIPRFTF